MFVTELTADSDYFLVGNNFASVSYSGDEVTYSFEIYGRLIQALIDGHDNVKIQIVKKSNPKIKYFVGESKKDVEISNLGFVQNTKQTLQNAIKDATVAETELELVNLLPDQTVSDIGSGLVTEENYVDYLPQINQTKIINRTSRMKSPQKKGDLTFQLSTLELFRNSGIYPGKVSDIEFPARKISENSDGLPFALRTVSQRVLLKNQNFADYYEDFYLRPTNTRISQRSQIAKAEYQKFKVEMKLSLYEYNLAALISPQSLGLRVVLVDNDIEVSTKTFRFKNTLLFEEATSGAKNIQGILRVPDPKLVLPDSITVFNRESFPVQVTLNEFYMSADGRSFEKNRLDIRVLAPYESYEAKGTQIYFGKSASRCYTISANKYIPGVAGVANVVQILSPPGTNVPPKINSTFDIQVQPGTDTSTAKLLVVGIKSPSESVLIYRKRIGFGGKELIGRVRFGRTSLTDNNIQPGEVYVYTAEMELNAASGFGWASTGYVALLDGDVTRISFSLTGKAIRGTVFSPKHSFKILESVSTTAASDLLTSANEAGQAGVFSSEIEASKQDTTVVSSYLIARVKKSTNQIEFLGTHTANKLLTFSFDKAPGKRFNPSETYEYIVMPRSVGLSSLSYKTVVEDSDVQSGKSFKYSFKKWRDPNYERSVVLPPRGEVIRDNIQAAFNNLPHAPGSTLQFSSQFKPGSITSFSAVSKENLDCAFLSWKYRGELLGILHFVVFANYNGYKAPIGIAIPDQNSGTNITISYCDDKLGNVSGEVLYSLLPVLKNGQSGNESSIVKVKSTKNYPSKALRR